MPVGKFIFWANLGIWVKLLVLLVCLAVLPLLFIAWQLLKINKEEITSITLELQTKLAEALSSRVEKSFMDSRKKADFLKAAFVRRDLTFE